MMKFNNILAPSLSVILFCAAALCAPSDIAAMSDARAQSSDCCIEPINPGDVVSGSIPAPATAFGCVLGDTQYRIDFPGGARKLVIDLNVSQSVIVSIRLGSPVAMEGGRIQADFFISRSISSPGVERFSFPSQGRANSSEPGVPLLQKGSYFIALFNCGRDAASYTLSAMILDPSDEARISISLDSLAAVEVGTVPAPEPGTCRIGRTQYLVDTFSFCGSSLSATLIVRGDQNVNLYARDGEPVTEENGIVMYDSLTTSPGKLQQIPVASRPPGRSTFFIAIENCGLEAVNYTLMPLFVIGDPGPFFIERVFLRNKDLHIVGFGLQRAEVFIDGVPQEAISGGRDNNSRDIIIIKKAKKMIARQQTVRITVSRGGCGPPPFIFTRP